MLSSLASAIDHHLLLYNLNVKRTQTHLSCLWGSFSVPAEGIRGTIDPHRCCGWGGLVCEQITNWTTADFSSASLTPLFSFFSLFRKTNTGCSFGHHPAGAYLPNVCRRMVYGLVHPVRPRDDQEHLLPMPKGPGEPRGVDRHRSISWLLAGPLFFLRPYYWCRIDDADPYFFSFPGHKFCFYY